jgi:hypothetical protein
VSAWRLAAVQAGAFSPTRQYRGVWAPALRGLLWLLLLVGEYRSNAEGTAVACIRRRNARSVARKAVVACVGLAVVIGLAAAFGPIVLLTVYMAVFLPLAPMLWRSARAVPAGVRLGRRQPKGGHVVGVHTVASSLPGAGRQVLQALNAEADIEGWTLTLVAADAPLVAYYARLGYTPRGPAETMSYGDVRTVMVRPPQATEAPAWPR